MGKFVFTKVPTEELDFVIEWEDWLATGEVISSSTWSVPTGLTESVNSFTDTAATIWLEGGVAGTEYNVSNTIVTDQTRTGTRSITILVREISNLRYLIPELRLKIGDISCNEYRYQDEWLEIALVLAVKMGTRWLNNKYLIENDTVVYRNTNSTFILAEPPVLEQQDEIVVILMAAILTLEGSLENSAWDYASWKDAEISYSNLESSRSRDRVLVRLWDELTNTIKPPMKRLARARKQSLPGYKDNAYEIGDIG